mgnify:CR=1 FL=1
MWTFRAWPVIGLQRSSESGAIVAARRPACPARVCKTGRMPPLSAAPWRDAPAAALARVRGVFTDIDDTLTRGAGIQAPALAALNDLAAAGIAVVAVTGRPMGWSLPFAQAWPVAAIVAENGAVAMFREGDRLVTEYAQDEATRSRNAERLRAVAARVLREVPGATLARDSAGRVTDIAVDHREFTHLDEDAVARVVALMQREGMNATVSSIHVNGWYGDHTKLSGARWMLRRLWGRELDAEIDRWLYVGDSTNDEAMFAAFPLSVGVANLLDFAERLRQWPAFITTLDRGRGFVEVAEALLAARGG